MAVVDPLMFRTWSCPGLERIDGEVMEVPVVVDRRTRRPCPSSRCRCIRPGARVGARVRTVEIEELIAVGTGRAEDGDGRAAVLRIRMVVRLHVEDVRRGVEVLRRHRARSAGIRPSSESTDGRRSRRRVGRGFRNMEHLPGSGCVRTMDVGRARSRRKCVEKLRDHRDVAETGLAGGAIEGGGHAPISPLPVHCRMQPGTDRLVERICLSRPVRTLTILDCIGLNVGSSGRESQAKIRIREGSMGGSRKSALSSGSRGWRPWSCSARWSWAGPPPMTPRRNQAARGHGRHRPRAVPQGDGALPGLPRGAAADRVGLARVGDLRQSQGVDDPERLKRWLYRAWRERHVRYVLLVGDADVVPVRYMVLDRITPAAYRLRLLSVGPVLCRRRAARRQLRRLERPQGRLPRRILRRGPRREEQVGPDQLRPDRLPARAGRRPLAGRTRRPRCRWWPRRPWPRIGPCLVG